MLAFCSGTKEHCITRDALKANWALNHDHTEGFEKGRIQSVEDGVLHVHGEGEWDIAAGSCSMSSWSVSGHNDNF